MLCSAWSAVYAKIRLHDVDPVSATGIQLLAGAVCLLWATWALESHKPTDWSRPAVVALVFLATFGSALAFALYYWLLKHMQAYQISTISLVIPAVAVLEGSLILDEQIRPMMALAIIVVLGSVGAVLRAEADAGEALSIKGQEAEVAPVHAKE